MKELWTANMGRPAEHDAQPAPCGGCPHAKRCAAQLLACHDFERFLSAKASLRGPVTLPMERIPTRQLYDMLHAHQPTRAEQEWRKAGRARSVTRLAFRSPARRT